MVTPLHPSRLAFPLARQPWSPRPQLGTNRGHHSRRSCGSSTAIAAGSVTTPVIQASSATLTVIITDWDNPRLTVSPPRLQQHGCPCRFVDDLCCPSGPPATAASPPCVCCKRRCWLPCCRYCSHGCDHGMRSFCRRRSQWPWLRRPGSCLLLRSRSQSFVALSCSSHTVAASAETSAVTLSPPPPPPVAAAAFLRTARDICRPPPPVAVMAEVNLSCGGRPQKHGCFNRFGDNLNRPGGPATTAARPSYPEAGELETGIKDAGEVAVLRKLEALGAGRGRL